MTGTDIKKPLYIPVWIYKKLVKAGVNIIDSQWLADNPNILSIDELATLALLNGVSTFLKRNTFSIGNSTYPNIGRQEIHGGVAWFFDNFKLPYTPAFMEAIEQSIATGDISDQLNIRLYEKVDSAPYTFINGTYILNVVLNPTFGYVLKSDETKLEFVRNLLNELGFDNYSESEYQAYLDLLSRA